MSANKIRDANSSNEAQTSSSWPWVGALAAAALGLLLLLPNLGSPGLWDPWEMDRAHLARQMAGPTRVAVFETARADGSAGPLATALAERFAGQVALFSGRPPIRSSAEDKTGPSSLESLAARIDNETVQLILVDLAISWSGPADKAGADRTARELDRLASANEGALLALDVSRCGQDGTAALQAIAAGRVRNALESLRRYGLTDANAPFAEKMLAAGLDNQSPFWVDYATFNGAGDPLFEKTVQSVLGTQWLRAQFKEGKETFSIPLLDTWLAATSFKLFGFSEFSARLPAALWAVFGLILLFWLSWRLFDPTVAGLAVLVLATTPLYMMQGRSSVSALSFSVLFLAALGIYLLILRNGWNFVRFVLYMLCTGLLFLSAGLFGILALWLVMAAILFVTQTWRREALYPFISLSVLLLVLVLLVLSPSQWTFWHHFRFMNRLFEGGPDTNLRNFDYFVRQLGFGLFPWSALLPAAMAWIWIGRDGESVDRRQGTLQALTLGFGVPLLLQMLALRDFSHCVFIAVPIGALITAHLLAEVARRVPGTPAVQNGHSTGIAPVDGLIAFVGFVVILILAMQLHRSPEPLVSFLAYDPPFSSEVGQLSFPEAITMPRLIFILGTMSGLLLLVFGCSLGTRLRTQIVERFRRPAGFSAGLWTLGTLWLLDVIVSLAWKFDTILKLPAARELQPAERGLLVNVLSGPWTMLIFAIFGVLALTAVLQGTHWGTRIRQKLLSIARLEKRFGPTRRRPVSGRFQAIAALLILAGVTALILQASHAWSVVYTKLFADQEDDFFARLLWKSPDILSLYFLCGCLLINRLWKAPYRRFALPFRALELFERPRWFVASLIVIAGGVTGWSLFGLQAALSIHVSQKHILQTYLSTEGRSAIGDNLFKHGTFASRGHRENNFYTNAIPDIPDRNQVIQALLGKDDLPLRLSVTDGQQKSLVIRGWDPKNDRNHDQKRDWNAYSGLMTGAGQQADGGYLEDKTAQWHKDQWKGFAVFDSAAKQYAVRSNTETRLQLDQAPPFVAGLATRNYYVIDDPAAANHRASAPQNQRVYFLLPKLAFSELNFAYRKKSEGDPIHVLDASSSQFILATGFLKQGEAEQNWIAKHLPTEAQMRKTPRFRPGYANFDDKVEYLGHALTSDTVRRGSKFHLRTFFRCKGELTVSYMIFMHVDGEGGANRIHSDHWPLNLAKSPGDEPEKNCNGCFQTRHWLVGDLFMDEFENEVPLGTPSGEQDIWMGFYNPNDEKRLPVKQVDNQAVRHDGENRIRIGSFDVN